MNYFYLDNTALGVDIDAGQLWQANNSVAISPVAAKLLATLIDSNTFVGRDQLFDILWPGQVISDDTLTKLVSELRNKLKQVTGTGNWVKTLPKRGYQWQGQQDAPLVSKAPQYLPTLAAIAGGIGILIFALTLLWPKAPRAIYFDDGALQPTQLWASDYLKDQLIDKTHWRYIGSPTTGATYQLSMYQRQDKRLVIEWMHTSSGMVMAVERIDLTNQTLARQRLDQFVAKIARL